MAYHRVIYYNLCRLCASDKEPKIDLFGESAKILELISKIVTCLSLKIQDDDDLPKKVCENCIKKLEDFFDFRSSCKDAENILFKYFETIKLNNNQDVMIYTKEPSNNLDTNNKNWQNLSFQLNKQFLSPGVSLQQISDSCSDVNIDGIMPTIQLFGADSQKTAGLLNESCVQPNGDSVVGVDEVLFSNQVCDLIDSWRLSVEGDKAGDLGLTNNDLSQIQSLWYLPSQLSPEKKVEGKKIDETSMFIMPDNVEEIMVKNISNPKVEGINEEINIEPQTTETPMYLTDVKNGSLSNSISLTENGDMILLNVDKDNLLNFNNTKSTILILNNDPLKEGERLRPVMANVSSEEGGQREVITSFEPQVTTGLATQIDPPHRQSPPPKKNKKKRTKKNISERMFECKECNKKYLHKEHLARHTKVHSPQNWECKIKECGKKFHRKDNYTAHTKRVHKIYCCEKCGKEFTESYTLYLQHVHSDCEALSEQKEAVAKKQRPECDICGAVFSMPYRLLRHRNTHFNKKKNKKGNVIWDQGGLLMVTEKKETSSIKCDNSTIFKPTSQVKLISLERAALENLQESQRTQFPPIFQSPLQTSSTPSILLSSLVT